MKIIEVRNSDRAIVKVLGIAGSVQIYFTNGRAYVSTQVASNSIVGIDFLCNRATAEDLVSWLATPNQDYFSVVESRA